MYVNPANRIDRAAGLAFAAARGFGLVIACDAGRPLASPLPFCLEGAEEPTPRLLFHVARPNPLAALAAKGGVWLVSVLGPDAYVSPDWYASADQVPTWLYTSVQLSGPVRAVPAAETLAHVDRLSAEFEQRLAPKPPWRSEKLTANRREALLKGIVAIAMQVETIEGSVKLNQQKSDADNVAIARALAQRDDVAARTIAARMTALRPHLDYDNAP
jgi:transcriptional regulator